jgi:hypothetical protein
MLILPGVDDTTVVLMVLVLPPELMVLMCTRERHNYYKTDVSEWISPGTDGTLAQLFILSFFFCIPSLLKRNSKKWLLFCPIDRQA